MARSVHDIDVRAVVFDSTVLREDRDPAFLFQVVRVHHALNHLLVFAEGTCLAQELVDQGGLAMIDVGDDGDVTDGAGHCGVPLTRSVRKINPTF
ncbi:hypothetical protein D3C87_1305750 [compost metagenome]